MIVRSGKSCEPGVGVLLDVGVLVGVGEGVVVNVGDGVMVMDGVLVYVAVGTGPSVRKLKASTSLADKLQVLPSK